MQIILEGDKAAIDKVERVFKRLLQIKQPSLEHFNEDYRTLFEDVREGSGIQINHCLTRFINNKITKKEFLKCEVCLRLSKSNAIFIVSVNSTESPYLLTINSRIEADAYFVIDNEYSDEILEEDIIEMIYRIEDLREARKAVIT